MAQPKYIFNTYQPNTRRLGRHFLGEIHRIYHPAITKQYDTINMPGFGKMPVVKKVGEDERIFSIRTSQQYLSLIPATKDGINQRDLIDQQIEVLQLRKQSITDYAWGKAHKVQLQELESLCKEQTEKRGF